jgi:hypothetical protein
MAILIENGQKTYVSYFPRHYQTATDTDTEPEPLKLSIIPAQLYHFIYNAFLWELTFNVSSGNVFMNSFSHRERICMR